MKHSYLLLSFFLLLGCQPSAETSEAVTTQENQPDYAALKAELEEIYDLDQGVRNIDWDTLTTPEASIAFSKRMMAVDSATQSKVIPMLEQYGWVPESLIGEKAASAIFLVIQHSNLVTIEKYLPQMEALAKEGEASSTAAAMMRDRLLMFQGKKQIYGTQAANWVRPEGGTVIWPVEDAENVNERRKEMGFTTTIEENAKRLGAEYDPNEKLPPKKNDTSN